MYRYMYEPANSDFTPVGYTHKAEVVSFKLVLSARSDLPTACGQHHLEVTRVIERIEHPKCNNKDDNKNTTNFNATCAEFG